MRHLDFLRMQKLRKIVMCAEKTRLLKPANRCMTRALMTYKYSPSTVLVYKYSEYSGVCPPTSDGRYPVQTPATTAVSIENKICTDHRRVLQVRRE